MSTTASLPCFHPAGYLLVLQNEVAEQSNVYRQEFGSYYGVDRLPPFILSGYSEDRRLPFIPITDPRITTAVDEWFTTREGPTHFIPNFQRAFALYSTFIKAGLKLELLFCELVLVAGEEDRLKDYLNVETIVVSRDPYGFDVSWPTATHSAILQPGVVSRNPTWKTRLNQYGLLMTYDEAAKLRTEYLSIYPYPPFDVYRVSRSCD